MQVSEGLKGGRTIARGIMQLFQYNSCPGNSICKFLGLGSRTWKKVSGRKLEFRNMEMTASETSYK